MEESITKRFEANTIKPTGDAGGFPLEVTAITNLVLPQHDIVREGCNIETRTFDFQDSMESILRIQCEVHRCDCPTFRNMAVRGRVERPARAAQGGRSDDKDTEVRQEKQMCPKPECTEIQ